MKYRDFGNTGVKVSSLGFGCMRLPMLEKDGGQIVNDELAIPMIRRGFEGGINYFDTAWGYCHQDSQRAMGKALHDVRDKVYFSTKLPMGDVKKPADFDYFLNASLERLDTDHIDFYHLHGIDKKTYDEKFVGLHLLPYAEKALSDGRIKHLSFSFHDDPQNMRYLADTELFSSVLCQYNLIDRANEDSIRYVREKGLGVTVMGPVGGGNIAGGGPEFLSKFNTVAKSAVELALRFVWGNPYVSCALSGMQTIDMVNMNLALAEISDTIGDAEWRALVSANEELTKLSNLYCTGCEYCDVCPQKIKPFQYLRNYNRWKVWGLETSAKEAVKRIGENINTMGAKVDECLKCGLCSAKCPQHIDIPAEIARVAKEFSENI